MNNHIIAKTALKIILAVLGALIIAFGVASIAFPGSMASLFESMGNYSFATGYASLAYTYSPTTENLARCVDDSILANDDANTESFAKELVAKSDFDDYCASVDEQTNKTCEERYGCTYEEKYGYIYSYRQFVYGRLACAQYNRGKKADALATAKKAMEGVSGFPKNNALVALSLRSVKKGDTEFSQELLEAISQIDPTPDQQEYYEQVKSILS